MTDTTDLPLAGVRILAVEQYGAGPFGTMYMADLGAEVIKIEPPATKDTPGGDSSRQSGPHFLGDNDSHFFQTFNRNKRSLTLNLKSPEGRDILQALARTADAVMNNLRGDQPAALRLTYADLGSVKPAIVCGHLSGYGRVGPRAAWPGYDYLMQAEAGFLSLTGEPDGPPVRMGLSIIDYMTGITAAFALTAALFAAARTGKGRDVNVTLYDVAMHQLSYPATWYLNEGTDVGRRPRSGHPSVVPCELVKTADGWIFIMCVLPKFWTLLCETVGRPDLPKDPRFTGFRERYENRDALMGILDGELSKRTTAQWMALFGGRVPAAPILDLKGALDNPYFREAGGIQTVDHPHRPDFRMVSSPIRLDGARPPGRPGPALGADSEALLAEIGYDAARVKALRSAGVI